MNTAIKITQKHQYTLAELVAGLDVTIQGDVNCVVDGVCTIQDAVPGKITFLTNTSYKKYLATTAASAVILKEKDVAECNTIAVIAANPHYIYSQIARFFSSSPARTAGIHPSATIGVAAEIDSTASIGPHCVLGRGVKIGPNVILGAGCIIEDGVTIGDGTEFDPRVTIYHGVSIGKRVRIASGAVIGSEGFGFANERGKWYKVPQLGSVVIGDDVDIGANTTIDRGTLDDTMIEEGVKLDNLIQIGHNVHIGAHTLIAGCVAIAGSTSIGKHCLIGGATNIAGHLTICDQTMLTGMTAVTKSITTPGMYSSGIVGAVPNHEFRKNNARFHRLENLMERVKNLEAILKGLKERTQT